MIAFDRRICQIWWDGGEQRIGFIPTTKCSISRKTNPSKTYRNWTSQNGASKTSKCWLGATEGNRAINSIHGENNIINDSTKHAVSSCNRYIRARPGHSALPPSGLPPNRPPPSSETISQSPRLREKLISAVQVSRIRNPIRLIFFSSPGGRSQQMWLGRWEDSLGWMSMQRNRWIDWSKERAGHWPVAETSHIIIIITGVHHLQG